MPFRKEFSRGLLGMIGEHPVGDALEQREHKIASVLSIAELLRVYDLFVQKQTNQLSVRLRSDTVTTDIISRTRMQSGSTSQINATRQGLKGS